MGINRLHLWKRNVFFFNKKKTFSLNWAECSFEARIQLDLQSHTIHHDWLKMIDTSLCWFRITWNLHLKWAFNVEIVTMKCHMLHIVKYVTLDKNVGPFVCAIQWIYIKCTAINWLRHIDHPRILNAESLNIYRVSVHQNVAHIVQWN